MNNYIPECGDLIWLTLSPTEGYEQAGRRPCYVVTPKIYNSIGLCLVCPITSRIKGYAGEVALNDDLRTTGVVLTDHPRSVDWSERAAVFIEKTNVEIQNKVYQRIHALIRPI